MKPIRCGLGSDMVLSFTARGDDGELKPAMFTHGGAQQFANRRARKSGMPGAVGIVVDCGEYWRCHVAAQRER